MIIKAVPTFYKGYEFRSQLEVLWAFFFDALKMSWAYEPQTYRTHAGPYLPDFQIINRQDKVFVEIKPDFPTAQEQNKCIALMQCFDNASVFLCYGTPGAETIMPVRYNERYQTYLMATWQDDNYSFWTALHPCTDETVLMAYHTSSTRQITS
jgi:hypothetical protein